MEEGSIHLDLMVIAHEQSAEVPQPGEGAFDFPALAVTTQGTAIVERGFAPASAVRTDEQDAALEQSPTQRVAVVTPVGNHAQRALLRTTPASTRHRDPGQRAFSQRHFPRAGRDQLASQRNTLAVDHHHPLRAFAALGFADALAPFLAGAKLPSRKDSLQSSLPRWSSSARNCRHTLSHTSCSSHWRKRRQQVLGLGYSLGRSRHRAPVLSTHRIPSSTRRFSAHGRPRLRTFGRSGSILAHCSSDKNACCIPSFSQIYANSTSTKCYENNLMKRALRIPARISPGIAGWFRFPVSFPTR